MVDKYTKTILTIIAIELFLNMLGPVVQPRLSGAANPIDVRLVDVEMSPFCCSLSGAVPVKMK